MSADIEKLAVFDDRIVQSRPKFAVEKGALSVTNAPFNAIAVNTSQHTYNVLVPSENIFIDRAVDWTSTCFLQVDVTANKAIAVGDPIFVPGRDFALSAFPLQSLTTTLTATINDTTVTINSNDVLPQVLRMTDYKKNRTIRTCPTQLDKYTNYELAANSINSPINGYDVAMNVDEVPNGAFAGLFFTSANGTRLTGVESQAASGAFLGWTAVNGIPCPTVAAAAGDQFRLYVAFKSTEKLVLSPFVFSDSHEWDCGLFGCQNIQLVMNLQAPSRVLRSVSSVAAGVANAASAADSGINYGGVSYNANAQNGGFGTSTVNLQFLTPSLDISLPPKSVVPYMEFPRYITSNLNSGNGASQQLQSQTIVLPVIPDLLMIWVRPQVYSGDLTTATASSTQWGDFMLPIQNISVNFDNFAGLLSAHTQPQLYKMSVNNGLELDWAQWSGRAGPTQTALNNAGLPLVGGMLVLKPGRDVVLQAGQASGLVGNFVLQFNLTVDTSALSAAGYNNVPLQIYVVTANSGFFETIKGSSRVIKGCLTEQDIISAPVAPMGTHGALKRAVGAGVLSKMGNAMSAIKDLYHQSKPAVSAVKNCLEATGNAAAGRVASALGNVGYGRGRRRESDLEGRLM